jgi:type IV pilus assembly protein PilF
MRLVSAAGCAILLLAMSGCSSLEQMKETTEKNRRIAQTHTQLGVGYLQQGKLEVALEKLQKAISADYEYAPAHSSIAIVYERLLKYDEAGKHYREAIDLSPEDGSVFNNYGVFLCNRGRAKEAEKYFIKAIEMPRYPTPELAYENAGTCARKIPDLKKSEDYLTAALKRNPELPIALLNMAQIRFEQNNYLSSRGFLQRFEAVSQHSAESLWLGVRIERKLGDKSAEASYAKQLQSKFPKSEQFQLLINSQGENQS